ncbi:tetratricopeptide repeat protein [Brevundimonas sp. TWP2-3-4b1]|uniref:tetratricopeptide repeat protein n=1 Tax=Brevundimonas sp. TWP2-3-4b1 TaxID=2804580 RepID=UPI003CEFBA1C
MTPWGRLRRWFRRLGPPPPAVPPSRAQLLAGANAARDRRDWAEAARLYADVLALDPADGPIQVQRGHALKEAGLMAEAEAAYAAAVALRPTDADAHLQLGHLLRRLGRPGEANAAFAQALAHDPNLTDAREALIAAGVRRDLPEGSFGRPMAATSLDRIAVTLEASLDAVRDWVSVSTFPIEAYGSFRGAHPIQPPPIAGVAAGVEAAPPVLVILDARAATPAQVRTTLNDLIDQRVQAWTALVRAEPEIAAHPVAGHQNRDPRIHFIAPSPETLVDQARGRPDHAVISLPAGVRMDREALGWMTFALTRTGATAVYCDHDHHDLHWREGVMHRDPALHPALDPIDLLATPSPPIAVMTAPGRVSIDQRPRETLLSLSRVAPVAHLSRILFSLPAEATGFAADPVAETIASGAILGVVIPTRDQPGLLAACVASLRAKAARPDLLRILVLDNRSQAPETADALARLVEAGEIEVLAVDEPFNWSRLNDIGAARVAGDYLVFANDDIEMRTQGWDDHLRAVLETAGVAAAGVRLVYPDGALQHGGMALGAGDGRPGHEGVGATSWDHGPLGRWARNRLAAAVTGAFLAVRRDAYTAAGGFDQALAVGYSDIDLCLRLRQDGGWVVYAGEVEATHHESRTRGLNDTLAKVAWDDAELFDLFTRWGQAILSDPSVNPQWFGDRNRPFEAIRDLSLSQVLASLDASATRNPWSANAVPVVAAGEKTFPG